MEAELDSVELFFWEALALLAAATLFVTLFKRLGLSSVLGYLAAGLVIGPILRIVTEGEELLHFAEFGVTLLLFVIGLELKPSRLWQMKVDIFGMGAAQVVGTGVLLALPAWFLAFNWRAALVVGFGLALSSTALVLQDLAERGQRASPHGRKAFSILLFQDLAIVPLLLLVSLLAPSGEEMTMLDGIVQVGIAALAVTGLVLAGLYLLDPLFRLLASTDLDEIMTAAALAIVIGAAGLMSFVGMSYAMGAFIAGVMLAESNYRHELEADIEPFRGLFLGLFFMAIGMTINFAAVAANWWIVLVAVPTAMTLKALTLYGIMRAFGNEHAVSVRTALTLPQHGEFGFVLFSAAVAAGLLGSSAASSLLAIVAISMALSPLCSRLEPYLLPRRSKEREVEEDFSDAGGRALVIGFGRFGQMASQLLLARDTNVTIIDRDAKRVEEARKFGFRIYYGDGTRTPVLKAAGANEAAVILVCADGRQNVDRIVEIVQDEWPDTPLLVRSYDRGHSIDLRRRGVETDVREVLESALLMGSLSLKALGADDQEVAETLEDVRNRDRKRLGLQVQGDIRSGRELQHGVDGGPTPEPLTRPTREAKTIDAANDDPETKGRQAARA